ncbi:hypothetical protein ACCO45_013006 [Purpureocillium lilacinum]|uniref:Uncharacterized protein n=1 Tax=Purpureocillium lilacinum TaxID=33203 RepID=A0ACC4DCP0_PURLI
MSRGGTTLYVTGFSHGTRARDLAYEFERYGRLVRCDIPAPARRPADCDFAFVEYEDKRDADDAYYEMHNKRLGRDDILKIEWARTPPSASWRFESGRDRDRRGPVRPVVAAPPLLAAAPATTPPAREDRRDRDRDYDRDSRRDRDRSRSPDPRDRDRDVKDERDDRDRDDRDRDDRDRRENGTNGEGRDRDRKGDDTPPPAAHDELDVAE